MLDPYDGQGEINLGNGDVANNWNMRILPGLMTLYVEHAGRALEHAAGVVYKGDYEDPHICDEDANVAVEFIYIREGVLLMGVSSFEDDDDLFHIIEYRTRDSRVKVSRWDKEEYLGIMDGNVDYDTLIQYYASICVEKRWNDLFVVPTRTAEKDEIAEMCTLDISDKYAKAVSAALRALGSDGIEDSDGEEDSVELDARAVEIIDLAEDLEALVRSVPRSATRRQTFTADAESLKREPGIDEVLVDSITFRTHGERISLHMNFRTRQGSNSIYFVKDEEGMTVTLRFPVQGRDDTYRVRYVFEYAANTDIDLVRVTTEPRSKRRMVEDILSEWIGHFENAVVKAAQLVEKK